jgi:hypothetical protein
MTEKTDVRIRETRRLLDNIDRGSTAFSIFVASSGVGFLSGGASMAYVSGGQAWGIGIGNGLVCLVWLFALVWARRAWLIARANFEILTDGTPSAGQPAAQSVEVEGALVEDMGVVFAVAMVGTPGVMDDSDREKIYREWLSDSIKDFAGKVIVLAHRETDGRVTYQGRPDIVDLLVEIDPSTIPWQKFRSA